MTITSERTTMTRSLAVLLAVVCGVTTANAYYAQPLLHRLAAALHTTQTAASGLVTAGQIGTAVGLVFLVPLGDIARRRTLLIALLGLDALALAGSALAPGIGTLTVLAVAIGLAAVAVPVVSAYAATLADDTTRGRTLGTIMSGVLLGILLSRTIAGSLAELGGWRLVYAVAAVAMLALVAVVATRLPEQAPTLRTGYPHQLRAVFTQFRAHPVLRWRCALGACVMATFTGFWTAVVFLLAAPPFGLSEFQLGLFALAGVAGALTTSFGGRFIDAHRRLLWAATGVAILVLAAAFGVLALGAHSLVLLVVGAVVLDAAMQAIHVLNQSVIYELEPAARARLASGYLACFAVGGAAGSVAFATAYARAGWAGVCGVGTGFACLAALAWLGGRRAERAEHEPRAASAA